MRDRKGQVNTLAPAILALVFAAIVLVFGIIIASELTDTTNGDQLGTITANETVTVSEASGESAAVTGRNACGFTRWNATTIFNSTTDLLTEGGNYTVNAGNGTVFNLTASGTSYLVTYEYTHGGEACDASNETVVGLGTFGDFWVIIVLAIVISVVIGLLLVIFGTGGRR